MPTANHPLLKTQGRNMESHREIAEQAAALVLKRSSGDWSAEEQAQLDAWLEASIEHRVAFLRLEAVWDDKAGALQTLGHGHAIGTVPPRGQWRKLPFFRTLERAPNGPSEASAREMRGASVPGPGSRRMKWAAVAASLVAIGAATYFLLHHGLLDHGTDRYSTPIGGMASVPLRDGSHITLNTASEVRVVLSATERRIDLDQGEVFFEVAKDPKRPFIVRAGDKRVVAVGTKFSVSRDGDEVRVVVTEGTVRLESVSTPLHLQEAAADSIHPSADVRAISLATGTVTRTRDQDLLIENTPLSQAEELLSWREGYLTFHETRLAEVVAELNRYNVRKITIADPALASIRISGAFRPTNADAFLRLLEDGYSLRATSSEDTTTLRKD
jgi:transmembrane sensor